MILGITGGVGCGKSTVLEYLRDRYGAYLILCDDVARDLQMPGGECYQPMIRLFREYEQAQGKGHFSENEEHCPDDKEDQNRCSESKERFLNEDGTFDRKEIAKMVFADKSLRSKLNGIVHPAVKRRVRELIAAHEEAALIVIEAALLLEERYGEICDEIWYIHTDDEVRRQRLKDSRGYSDQKIDEIFRSQRSEMEFRSGCVLTIDNSSENIQNTFRQLDEALSERGIFAVQNFVAQIPVTFVEGGTPYNKST